jgi:hypothetical protein
MAQGPEFKHQYHKKKKERKKKETIRSLFLFFFLSFFPSSVSPSLSFLLAATW